MDSPEIARLERYRVETDAITARNEVTRKQADAEIRERDERRMSDIRDKDERRAADIESQETDREDTRYERRFFMGVTAFGVVLTAVMSILAATQDQPVLFSGTGVGLLAFGTGLLKLRVLTGKEPKPRQSRKAGKGKAG